MNTTIDNVTNFNELMAWCKSRTETALDHWLPPTQTCPPDLHEAMRYVALAGGKYIRPLIVYALGKTLDIPSERLDGPASAVELIHAYSLTHDDLPAMDDDDLRRGKPSCHRVYGDAIAILTGDALQSLAFHVLAHDPAIKVEPSRRLRMIDTLSVASGSLGMAGGQAMDLGAVGQNKTLEELEYMHKHKTGALIRAAAKLAELSAEGLDDQCCRHIDQFARCIGLAFQIRDDILDVEGETTVLGKTQGADMVRLKPTYPSLLGMAGAKQKALELHEMALDSLEPLGKRADPLRWISEYVVNRNY